ncbi:hypothetical protein AOLI_G00222580 [Acnodon oligacanthus]
MMLRCGGLSVDSYFTLYSVVCATVSAWRAELCVAMATRGRLATARPSGGEKMEHKTSQGSLEVTDKRLCSAPVAFFPPFYAPPRTSFGLRLKADACECEIRPGAHELRHVNVAC